jgi:hypothetical protein
LNKRSFLIIISISIVLIGIFFYLNTNHENPNHIISNDNYLEPIFNVTTSQENLDKAKIVNNTIVVESAEISLRTDMDSLYDEISVRNSNVIVVYPIFTQSAYAKNGFYAYYRGECDSSCLTVPIKQNLSVPFSSSYTGFRVLQLLGYSYITDIDVDKNPNILKHYDKVIILHNEYMTQNEFDAIIHHQKVIYLYPNALYAKINVDYNNSTMTLVKGHGYPDANIKNGFDWKFDNSQLEHNTDCDNILFEEVDNGIMLNCYPEYKILYDASLLKTIKDW